LIDVKQLTLNQLNDAWAEKSQNIHGIYVEAGDTLDFDQVKLLTGDNESKVAELGRMNEELSAIVVERELRLAHEASRKAADEALKPANGMQHPGIESKAGSRLTVGEMFTDSVAYKSFMGGQMGTKASLGVDLKAVFRTGAGWDPEEIRLPRVELDPQRPIAVVDAIPMLPTALDNIRYMEETTFTNNAVETAEQTATTASDAIGEAALALTERNNPVEWLPVFIPVTMQQMEDVAGIEAYVTQRLQYMLRARLDLQVIQGNGSTPNIRGTNNVSGINTQAKGSDATPDAIYKGLDLVRTVGFAEPSVIFVHPTDWQAIRLLRTSDGIYIFGSPLDSGPERIWGVPVVMSTAVLQNTITLGDYTNFAALYTKRGIDVSVSDSHSFYFTRGLLAIRADMRIAMVHFRPEAFCTVTGV